MRALRDPSECAQCRYCCRVYCSKFERQFVWRHALVHPLERKAQPVRHHARIGDLSSRSSHFCKAKRSKSLHECFYCVRARRAGGPVVSVAYHHQRRVSPAAQAMQLYLGVLGLRGTKPSAARFGNSAGLTISAVAVLACPLHPGVGHFLQITSRVRINWICPPDTATNAGNQWCGVRCQFIEQRRDCGRSHSDDL